MHLTLLCCIPRPLTVSLSFSFNDTATTEIYTLSLHDALPISRIGKPTWTWLRWTRCSICTIRCGRSGRTRARSEEHTSELQSLTNLVCRLLLEKKKKKKKKKNTSQEKIKLYRMNS